MKASSARRPEYRLRNLTQGTMVASRVAVARSLWQRLAGLLGCPALPIEEGLMFPGCTSIHTHFMRFSIDVLILDSQWRVMRAHAAVPPWRMLWPVSGGWGVVELAAGALARSQTALGHQLVLESAAEPS